MRRVTKTVLLTSLLFLAAPRSHAGAVTVGNIGLDEGNTAALLESTSQYYVDAMRTLISDRYRDDYRAIRWEMLETALKEAQVARVEYRFVVNGETYIRVYHALGGRPLSAMAQAAFGGTTPAGTPGSPAAPLDADWQDATPTASGEAIDYAAMDAEDSALYSGFNTTNLRARILAPEPSVLEPFYVDGADRALDPEFKALRAIEHDLKNKVMPSGGTVRGIIGGSTCSSCRHTMQGLAESYDIDIHLTQMFGTLPRAEREALIASGRARLRGPQLVDNLSNRPILARDVLADAREQQVRRALNPSSLDRSFKGMPWRPRSFRLGPMHRPHGIETGEDTPTPNPDAGELPPPRC
ncbi:MAG TPA: hypothetical protein VN813_07355 [Luteibacter sp.]|nr:hypothetical protein [Luteibacter sp.]